MRVMLLAVMGLDVDDSLNDWDSFWFLSQLFVLRLCVIWLQVDESDECFMNFFLASWVWKRTIEKLDFLCELRFYFAGFFSCKCVADEAGFGLIGVWTGCDFWIGTLLDLPWYFWIDILDKTKKEIIK